MAGTISPPPPCWSREPPATGAVPAHCHQGEKEYLLPAYVSVWLHVPGLNVHKCVATHNYMQGVIVTSDETSGSKLTSGRHRGVSGT